MGGLAGIMLDGFSQREKDKYCIISLTCGSKTENKGTYITKQKQSYRYTEKNQEG